jgi:hypothetical protein
LSPSKKAIPLIRSLLHCRRGILTREGQKGYPYKRGTEGVALQERDRRGSLTREGQKGYPYKRGTEGVSLQERHYCIILCFHSMKIMIKNTIFSSIP